MKEKVTAKVISQQEIAANIFDMWIETGLAKEAHPGQFIGVFPKNKSTILPRPISICEVNEEKTALRIVYRIAGQGTKEFSSFVAGDQVDILGILGNGFPLEAGKIYTLTVELGRQRLKVWAADRYFELRIPELPEKAWLGITGCEGLNRFYNLTLEPGVPER